MQKHAAWIFLGVSVAFFLFVVGLTGYRVESSRRANLASAEQRAGEILSSALSVRETTGSFDSPFFKDKMREALKQEPRLLLLCLHSKTEGIMYLVARNRSYLKEPREITPQWRGAPQYKVNRTYDRLVSLPLPAAYPDSSMDAVFVVFGREDLYPIIRDDLYLFLTFILVCAIFILIWVTVREDREKQAPSQSKPLSAGAPSDRAPAPAAWPSAQPKRPPAPAAAPDRPPTSAGVPPDRQPAEPPPAAPVPAAPAPASPLGVSYAAPSSKACVSEAGLGLADQLPLRLQNEIERAASADLDLSLARIVIDRPPVGQSLGSLCAGISKILTDSFPIRDLLFEAGKDSFAVILPDVDIDQAVRAMESLRRRVSAVTFDGARSTVSIGVSSRAGRLIEGRVLSGEAEVAARKAAAEGGDRVIGFKADPMRFREALSAAPKRATPA